MALKYKGTVDVLPTEGVALYDAYYFTDKANSGASAGYRYCSAISGSSVTWSAYVPVKIIDNPLYNIVYEGKGAPTATANAVQFPTLDMGAFYLDGMTGAVYAYCDGAWQAW